MHREFEDLLLLYTTHSLVERDRQRLEAHLQTCKACRASLDEWRGLSTAVRDAANHRATSLPMLRLPDLEQEKNRMQPARALPQRHNYAPITFVAIAAMLVFAAVAFFARKPNDNAALIFQAATETQVPISPTGIPTIYVSVLMPARIIENGSVIGEGDVQLIPYPQDSAPFDILTSIDDAVGKIARTNLFCNQPILSNMLAENARDVPDTIPPLNATFDCTGGLPAAFEFTEVVIAVQNLTRGQAIPPNAVALRPFPSGLLPGMAYTSLEDVVGSIAPYDIYREQAITEQMLIQIPDASIPTGKVVVAVPLDRAVLVYGQQTIIDVYAPEIGELLEGTPVAPVISADGSYVAPTRMTRVADNAQIVGGENTLLVVAVSPEEATLLRRLIETDFPLTLVDAGLIEQSLASNPDMSDEVPEGMVAVSVPRSLILAVPHGLLSDHVDIVATLRFVDVDEDSQQPVTTSTPATTSVAQQVISNALQIPSDDPNVMTLVVSPEDAVVLTWLVEARIPLILVSPGSWPGDPILVPANP